MQTKIYIEINRFNKDNDIMNSNKNQNKQAYALLRRYIEIQQCI